MILANKELDNHRPGTLFSGLPSPSCNDGKLPGVQLIDKHKAAAMLAISPETLKKYRRNNNSTLIPGIHYFVWNQRVIKYNAALIADWAINRNNPEAHQKAIEAFLASLPSNQPRKRGRKRID